MKRIGIDARLYNKTGVGVYIRNLLHYLQELSPSNITYYIYLLKEESESVHFTSDRFIKRPVSSRWHSLSEQTLFLQSLNADNLDLMHFTYFSYPIFYKKKFIATIHDTILLDHKTGKASTQNSLLYEFKHAVFKYVLSSQIKNAAAIITPTESVKHHILQKFNCPANKIHPIYEGVNYELEHTRENERLTKIYNGNFFIYVGNFYPHKNVDRLIGAFLNVQTDAKLILTGPDDYFYNRLRKSVTEMELNKRIVFYTNPKIEDLVYFYKHAQALIHPSLDEGFGLPLIEAAYFNLPVIASDIEVFKEIMGDQYLSFNPLDMNDITTKINQFLKQKFRSDYQIILQKYSFKQMTAKILKIYENLL